MKPVVLAGGSGSRLWPKSRAALPKQFLRKNRNLMYRAKTTIEQWRILQAVVDFGGYAHAASHLNKSQSSLNHAHFE